jgi:maleate cis-trans isomerase
MAMVPITARLGLILSASNLCVEPFFRALAPAQLAIHPTRMHMASQVRTDFAETAAEAAEVARLVAQAKVDVIDLQATGFVMSLGAEAETRCIQGIEDATGIPAYTATQGLMEALRALEVRRVLLITPFDDKPTAEERAYIEGQGFELTAAVGLALGGGPITAKTPYDTWLQAAIAHDTPDAQAIVLSGSNTTQTDAIQGIEDALGKPAVTSVQAALWAGVKRVKGKLGDFTPEAALGRLGQTL